MRKTFFFVIFFGLLITNSFSLNIESKEISINDNQTHYYRVGNDDSKPNLIMLTGIATTANFWPKDFVKLLATKFNLYILDYRSFNTKQDGSKLDYSIKALANDTNNFITKLRLDNLYLLGWSMGGAVALDTVFSKQESFKHLFLISPSLPAIDGNTLLKKSVTQPLKTTDDVYNFVFTNNLYNYNPKNLSDETKRFISSDIKHLFPSGDIYAK